MWKLGLLGYPIAHSRSPSIHRAALNASGLEGDYLLFEHGADDLQEIMGSLREGRIHGLNVTIPHKERLRDSCDDLDPVAELVGAVNTLVPKDGRLVGYNTDVMGLEHALLAKWPEKPWSAKRCTIFGAGGAARAAA